MNQIYRAIAILAIATALALFFYGLRINSYAIAILGIAPALALAVQLYLGQATTMSMATTDVLLLVPGWETIKERWRIYRNLQNCVLTIEIQQPTNKYRRQCESFSSSQLLPSSEPKLLFEWQVM
jgi:hypothetical protein